MTTRAAPRKVALVAFADAQLLDIAGPLEVFSRAARLATDEGRRGPPLYTVEILARRAGPVTTSSGLSVLAQRGFSDVRGDHIDTLLVAGGRGIPAAVADRRLVAFVRRLAARVRRLASVCTGAFVLAEAGLLDGKRVTTHWSACARLAAAYPRLMVDPDPIFIRQGKLYTSAGVTAGMDLALALVEEDHGPRLARAVARELVLFLQRPGGQSQFSAQLEVQKADRAPLAELQAWMADHLREDLSVATLAHRVAMSPRNFARVFTRDVGLTPARFVERLRIEAARRRLEESDDGVEAVADACGFGSGESLRRAFVRALRVAPTAYRSRFSERRMKMN
jgi:transcriptional regulator GlxA family with amidase domain